MAEAMPLSKTESVLFTMHRTAHTSLSRHRLVHRRPPDRHLIQIAGNWSQNGNQSSEKSERVFSCTDPNAESFPPRPRISHSKWSAGPLPRRARRVPCARSPALTRGHDGAVLRRGQSGEVAPRAYQLVL